MPKPLPILTIVTPSYNQGRFIGKTIQSVLSQRGNFFIDYIVMDGGSSDNSLDVIKAYEGMLQDSSTTLVKNGAKFYVNKNKDSPYNRCKGISYRWVAEKDNGQVHAVNRGLQRANGSIYSYLNSDDLYYPDTLAQVAEYDWERTDFLYGNGMWISEAGRSILPYPTYKPSKHSLYYECTLCQPAVFIKGSTFRELGDFSTEYTCIFDYEYWLRAVFAGKKFVYSKKLFAKSRMYYENKSLTNSATVDEEKIALLGKYYDSKKPSLPSLLFSGLIVKRLTAKRTGKLHGFLCKTALPFPRGQDL